VCVVGVGLTPSNPDIPCIVLLVVVCPGAASFATASAPVRSVDLLTALTPPAAHILSELRPRAKAGKSQFDFAAGGGNPDSTTYRLSVSIRTNPLENPSAPNGHTRVLERQSKCECKQYAPNQHGRVVLYCHLLCMMLSRLVSALCREQQVGDS
jgi:hypothetical protein